jgi:hypothetical protein
LANTLPSAVGAQPGVLGAISGGADVLMSSRVQLAR